MSVGRVVVAGESLVDIVVPADGSGEHHAVGGSCLNVAVGLGRLDVATLLLTRIGHDELGRQVLEHLRGSDVEIGPDTVAEIATSTATAHLDEQQAATYDFSLTWDLPAQTLPEDAVALHVGSLGAVLDPGRATVVDLVVQASRRGVFVSFDPNLRPAFLTDLDTAWSQLIEIASQAQLVKLSEEDAGHVRPGVDPAEVCRQLLAGPATELVVLTRGSGGAEAFTESERVQVEAPTTEVVDTVGAGDSFTAALLAVLSEWQILDTGPGALQAMDQSRVELLAEGAAVTAAMTCARRGANPPTRRELPPTWPAS